MTAVYVCFELDRTRQREAVLGVFNSLTAAEAWVEGDPKNRRCQTFEVLTKLADGKKARALAKLTEEDREALGVGEFEPTKRAAPPTKKSRG